MICVLLSAGEIITCDNRGKYIVRHHTISSETRDEDATIYILEEHFLFYENISLHDENASDSEYGD